MSLVPDDELRVGQWRMYQKRAIRVLTYRGVQPHRRLAVRLVDGQVVHNIAEADTRPATAVEAKKAELDAERHAGA